jgi:hypothetical protein
VTVFDVSTPEQPSQLHQIAQTIDGSLIIVTSDESHMYLANLTHFAAYDIRTISTPS